MPNDVEWVVSTARQQDPSLEHDVAATLAAPALALAAAQAEPDAPAVARERLARYKEHGASAANAVAVAAVDYLGQA